MNDFNAIIDFRDIADTDVIKLMNEEALNQDNEFIKDAYMYDYLIQINLTTINGTTVKKTAQDPIVMANLFFKVRTLLE